MQSSSLELSDLECSADDPLTSGKGIRVGKEMTQTASVVCGVGMSVPDRVVPNSHFEDYLETNDQWIQDRTGIAERRWISDATTGASELAEPACRKAIESAGLSVEDIDGVICATVTPDYIFPSTACFLQKRLGIRKGFAFDVNAVCSGFVYALSVADSLIATGQGKNVLVVGVDIYSRIIDPNDRTTCVLFGDGAGAVVLSAASNAQQLSCAGEETNGAGVEAGADAKLSARGIYATELQADGTHTDILCVPNGSAKHPTPESLASGEHYLSMAGREVFKLAVRSLVDISQSVLEKTGASVDSVDYFVSHQANKRILMAMAKQMSVPEEKILVNVEKYGNTSAASIPILLAEFAERGVIKRGDLLLVSAFGGGVTWGAVLLRW